MRRRRGKFLAAILTAALVMTATPVSGLAAEEVKQTESGSEAEDGDTVLTGESEQEESAAQDNTEEEQDTGSESLQAGGKNGEETEAGQDAPGEKEEGQDTSFEGEAGQEMPDEEEAGAGETEQDDAEEEAEAGETGQSAPEETEDTEEPDAAVSGSGKEGELSDPGSEADGSGEAGQENGGGEETEEDLPDEEADQEDGAVQAGAGSDTDGSGDVSEDGTTADSENEAAATDGEVSGETIDVEVPISGNGVCQTGFGDSDELFRDYFDILSEEGIDAAQSNERRRNAGDNLTGRNRIVYWKLRNMGTEVAAGRRASTTVRLTIDDLGVNSSRRYTAADLGISTILVNGKICDAAVNKMSALISVDISAVNAAISDDCPYEFYWSNGKLSQQSSVYISADTNNRYIWFGAKNMEFSVEPSPYYAAGTNKVDTTVTGAAVRAVSNANSIISNARSMSDSRKLLYYKNRIMALSDYNSYAAANDDVFYENQNPWQIIYVFDGNPNTKVVCAGYARAFEYLCDKTVFNNNTIYAIYVTGTAGGPHAWNIVHMDDGRNYLVDITNSLPGTIGSDGSLFLKGAYSGSINNGYVFTTAGQSSVTYIYDDATRKVYNSGELILSGHSYGVSDRHTHTYGSWIVTRYATSAANGIRVKMCSVCGDAIMQDIWSLNGSNTKITGLTGKVYTGKAITQPIRVVWNGRTLRPGTDYRVSFSNNKNVGKATVTVTGLGSFGSSVNGSFIIRPKMTKITRLTAGKKKFKARWAKRKVQNTGYQIQYSRNRKFRSGTKSKYIKRANKIVKVIGGLKRGKTYYVRVRTYKKVNGKRYYSSWSKVRKIKVK